MKISYFVRALKFKFPFKIAHGIRTHTDCVFVKIELNKMTGYGEATMPPYVTDNLQTTCSFLDAIDLTHYTSTSFDPNLISGMLDKLYPANYSAKAAINMALWDLKGKLENQLVATYFKHSNHIPNCTYTIGLGDSKSMKDKLALASNFNLIKIKLDGQQDESIIKDYLNNSSKPFAVDANQSWKDKNYVEKMLQLLDNTNCFLIEQPFEKNDRENSQWIRSLTSIPIIADEAFQHIDELEDLATAFDGINIKLMKCGGISNAYKIVEKAKALDLKILIGCMSESACGCAAASVLQQYADWVDLDGPYLISNNPFQGYEVKEGKIQLQFQSGLGLTTTLF